MFPPLLTFTILPLLPPHWAILSPSVTRALTCFPQIQFDFRNQYGYYIGNTFLPSLIQVIISLVTLRFDLSDFQDRIMVSLTSLLVLATFFTQTSQSIPKTSYLKLIDVWFVALIFEDFAIILSLVYVETLRMKEAGHGVRVTKVSPISTEERKRRLCGNQ
ncbi:hypothetical protein O3P69_013021 [Scylla paramamosain]|uniref:Neurotransmitter-gated ion-channel transmembrane domain-containing protein n=1 Tax=Scylla paramamosain TaxID=85552 RepID=A0AAW0TU89_SCYPA